jgi:hypothetical protein
MKLPSHANGVKIIPAMQPFWQHIAGHDHCLNLPLSSVQAYSLAYVTATILLCRTVAAGKATGLTNLMTTALAVVNRAFDFWRLKTTKCRIFFI